MLMPPPLWHFSGTAMLYVQGHCICSNISHDEPCASDCPVFLGNPASSPLPCGWGHQQANFLLSLRIFDSEGVRLAEAVANPAGPSFSVMTALSQVNRCSTLIVSILDEAHSRCLTCYGSPETKAHVNQHLGSGPPTNQASCRSSAKNLSTISPGRSC